MYRSQFSKFSFRNSFKWRLKAEVTHPLTNPLIQLSFSFSLYNIEAFGSWPDYFRRVEFDPFRYLHVRTFLFRMCVCYTGELQSIEALIMLLILCYLMFSLGLSLKADFSGIQWRVSEGCFSILYKEIPTFLSFTLNQMNLKSFKWKVRSGFISENLHKAWGIFKGKMPKRSMQHQLLVQTMIALDQSPCTYLPETFWG